MINIVCLEGRLTKDPIFLEKKAGDPYLKFSLAHAPSDGINPATEYYDCICFEKKQIAYIKRHFSKGCLVFIKGKIHNYNHQDPTGEWIKTTSIILDRDDGALLLKEPRAKSVIKQDIGVPGGKEQQDRKI